MKVRTENLAEIFNSQTPVACVECNRVFDLWDEDEAGEGPAAFEQVLPGHEHAAGWERLEEGGCDLS